MTIHDTALWLTGPSWRADITHGETDDAAGGLGGDCAMAVGGHLSRGEIENMICFTPGTHILTPLGERPIESLRIGDMVVTRDSGQCAIRWIGQCAVAGRGALAPIAIAPEAPDCARAPLLVSPQHRMLFTGHRAELLFGQSEVLVAARDLVNGADIVEAPCAEVTYMHIMLDKHEIIYADGTATESFYAGTSSIGAMTPEARAGMFAIFPELRSDAGAHGRTARPCLRPHEARLIQ